MGDNYTPSAMRRCVTKASGVNNHGGKLMKSVRSRSLAAAALLAGLAFAAGCGSSSGGGSGGTGGGGGGAAAIPASTCQNVVGSGKYTIASDFPLQGSSQHQTVQMNQAIQLILEQHNW